MPVGRVARQARYLQSHHDAGPPKPHLRNQPLEALSIDRRGARATEVGVDDHHLLDSPAQGDCTLLQRVLALGALGVLEHLA